MDTVCEGGAECACSERTDAHVEHDEQRNVHARSRSPESPCCVSCALAAHYEFGSRGSLICSASRQRRAKASKQAVVASFMLKHDWTRGAVLPGAECAYWTQISVWHYHLWVSY